MGLGLCAVRKRFNSVREWRDRSKPGCWIVGSHTRWLLTIAAADIGQPVLFLSSFGRRRCDYAYRPRVSKKLKNKSFFAVGQTHRHTEASLGGPRCYRAVCLWLTYDVEPENGNVGRHRGYRSIRPRVDPPRVDPPHFHPKRGRSAPTSGTIRPEFWVVPPQHP